MTKLIVFLGNPGKQYRLTRHNAGFLVCEHNIEKTGWQEKFHGTFKKDGNCIYLMPNTYMNLSGVSVQEAAKFFNVSSDDILIVHDDLEMNFAEIKLQKGGGMGGHNGLKSVKQNLNTDIFWRLRIGIGRPIQMEVADWVTSRFSKEEETKLPDILSKAYDIIKDWQVKNQ